MQGYSRRNRVASSLWSIVISTSGFRGRHFEFGRRPTSENVDSVIPKSGLADNVGVEVEIATPFLTVEKLFPLPVLWSPS